MSDHDHDVRVVCQAASVLLQYPDEAVLGSLGTVAGAVRHLPDRAPRRHLHAFLDSVATMAARDLQEHYVQVLDRNRRCCLYLTWWTEGETRRRGLALARLKELYRSYGFTLQPGELPDFLPVVLEFAAVADPATGLQLLEDRRAAVELVRLALTEAKSLYAEPLRAVCALLPGPSPADEAAARALASTGPPTELVGIDIDLGPTSLLPYPTVPTTGPAR